MLLAIGLWACGSDDVTPLAMIESEPGTLELATTCAAEDLTARVEATDDEVRISDVKGTSIDGDCVGVLKIELQTPLGRRHVVVDGKRWVPLEEGCGWGSIGPPDLESRSDGCSPANPETTTD